jgi:hypothetical protein
LGSLLLLRETGRANRLGQVALLAPIFGFLQEHDLGGRIRRAQLKLTGRRMRLDPAAALEDFHRRAGLDIAKEAALPAQRQDWMWGLERLENDHVVSGLPDGWRAWCGDCDPLLDALRLREIAPSLEVVSGATHHPGALLKAFSLEVGRDRWARLSEGGARPLGAPFPAVPPYLDP